MSDRTDRAVANLTYEVGTITADQLAFYKRLHQVNPDLVTADDIRIIEERLHRLRTMFKSLQKDRMDG